MKISNLSSFTKNALEIMNTSQTQYGVLQISGSDAKKFLQGQLTCDMEEVTFQKSRLGAHCSPQGRVISLFNIFIYLDDYYLLMPLTLIPIALAALKKYAVFYKVSLEAITLSHDSTIIPTSLRESLYKNLMAGIPAIYPSTSGKFLPHELNLQALNAISFNKGCYTGQEIIARMHYRGKLKTHLFKAIISSSLSPHPGSDVYCQSSQGAKPGGIIIDSLLKTAEDNEPNTYIILLVCDEANAKDNHLFLDQHAKIPIIFLTRGDQPHD
jgi:folate-binding protein YgfZ